MACSSRPFSFSRLPLYEHCPNGGTWKLSLSQAAIDLRPRKFGRWFASFSGREELPDGTMKYLHVIGHPVLNKAGELVEFVGTTIDVTDRKRAEEVRLEERVRERTRIARELHDTLLQSFHGTLFHFQAASNLLPTRTAEA